MITDPRFLAQHKRRAERGLTMKLSDKESNQLKAIELDIFKTIICICEKLNLRYYVIGGTLIGAIRHKGFIPWDDDIDIGMTREDYNVFLKEAPGLLPEHLFLQTIWSDPQYLNCFAKVRNSNTTFIEKPVAHRKINHGVFVDIFPLDYYPETEKEQKRLSKKMRQYNARIAAEYRYSQLTCKQKLFLFLNKCRHPSWRTVLEKRDRLFQSFPKTQWLADYGGFASETAPSSWYGEGVQVPFEGMQVTAPKEYDKLLTQIYGDYMTPPPVEKREGHHDTQVLDLEKSYTAYMKE